MTPVGIWETVTRHAAAHSDRPAIVASGTPTSYGSLATACEAIADDLLTGGVGRGTRVALPLANSAESVARLLALAAVGSEILLIDPAAPDGEVGRLLDLFGAARVLTGAGLTPAPGRQRRATRTVPSRCFGLVTSGVNGVPKVVLRDWAASLANAGAFARAAGYGPDDGILVTTPLHHSYAFSTALLSGLAAGAALHLLPTPVSPASLASALATAGVTVVQSVPFLYRCLVDLGIRSRPAGLRACITAGEAAGQELRERWTAAVGLPLLDHYGTTEAGMMTFDASGDGQSVGRPLAGMRIRVWDETTGAVLPPGASGELVARLQGRASAYRGQPDLQRRSLAGGWFRTGDLGRIDRDGRVHIESRLSRRINVAGSKVDPVEVEQALLSHPAIRECAVIGRPSVVGQDVWAFVVASESLSLAAVRRFLRGRLSGHKQPRHLVQLEALPKTASGKVRLGLLPGAAR